MSDEQVWLRAWLAVAPSFNAKVDDCTRYADRCLADFKARFRSDMHDNSRRG